MKLWQVFNRRMDSWVKFKVTGQGSRILDVKQRQRAKPFKGVRIYN